MIHRYFLDVVVVGVVQKCQIFEGVVLERDLSQSLKVVEGYGGKIEVVSVDVLAFGCWRDRQSWRWGFVENDYSFFEVEIGV